MNILLFGKTGQVGWELQRALAPLGNLIALDVHSTNYCGDFSNPEGVAETVKKIRPDVKTRISCAQGYSSVSYCSQGSL